MNAGDLNELIKVLKYTIAKSEFGEEITSWNEKFEIRAKVNNSSNNRITENHETTFNNTKQFIVRYYQEIGEFDRIRYNSKDYRIIDLDKNKALQNITITAKVINE